MQHPFDGINDANSPSPEKPAATPDSDTAANPTRRVMLGHMAMAAAAALVEVNRAAAQPVPPGAVPPPGQRHGSWRHMTSAPGGPFNPNEEGMIRPRPAAASQDLTSEQLETAWKAMGETDANKARAAANQIFSAKKGLPFLKEKLKAINPKLDENKIAQLIGDLDDNVFATRAKASDDLLQMGPGVMTHLQAALTAKPSLEKRQRLEMLVLKLKSGPVYLQGQRGLHILIDLPMKEAKEAVAEFTKQSPETWLTKAVKDIQAPNPVMPAPAPPRVDINAR